jgi:hypothetical protein
MASLARAQRQLRKEFHSRPHSPLRLITSEKPRPPNHPKLSVSPLTPTERISNIIIPSYQQSVSTLTSTEWIATDGARERWLFKDGNTLVNKIMGQEMNQKYEILSDGSLNVSSPAGKVQYGVAMDGEGM